MMRYDIWTNHNDEESWLETSPSDEGEWVKAEEALALEKELNELKAYLATGIKVSMKPEPPVDNDVLCRAVQTVMRKGASPGPLNVVAGSPLHKPIIDAVSTKQV
jgi:hypothetical protein